MIVTNLINRRRHLGWLLNDTFSVDMAAGTLNGTPASGGPGTRTVTDTENKLSVVGGVLSFAGGKASSEHGDPGIWYGAVTRVAGRMVLAKANIATRSAFGIGFDTNQAGFLDGTMLYITADLRPYTDGVDDVGLVDANTDYLIAVVLRAVGGFYFLKGGAFVNWTLLWVSRLDSTATLYPGIANHSSVFTADSLRIPTQLWLPSPLASDSFTRANGALGSTDGLGHAEQNGGNGLAWTFDSGVWTVASNVAVGTPGVGSELLTDGGLENWTTPLDLTSWVESVAGLSTINQENVNIHGGTYAARLDVDVSSNTCSLSQTVSAGVGKWVIVSAWSWTSGGGTIFYDFEGSLVLTKTNGAYTNNLYVKRTTGAISEIRFRRASASTSTYVDDVSVKVLTISSLFASVVVSTPDVLAEAAVTLTAGTQAGVVLNLDSAATPANFVIAYHDGTNCLLEKCVAGVYTTVISAAATYSAGAVLRVIKDGTAYRLYYNNALVGTGTISDAGIVSNVRHGLFSTYSNQFDDFVVRARGTGNEYSALDAF